MTLGTLAGARCATSDSPLVATGYCGAGLVRAHPRGGPDPWGRREFDGLQGAGDPACVGVDPQKHALARMLLASPQMSQAIALKVWQQAVETAVRDLARDGMGIPEIEVARRAFESPPGCPVPSFP